MADLGGLLGLIQSGEGLARGIIPGGILGSTAAPMVPPPTVASTRFPTAVNRPADPVTTLLHSGDVPAFMADKTGPFNVGLLGSYPGMSFLKGMPAPQASQAAAQRMSENLTYLFERSPKVMQDVSPIWYFGGNHLVNTYADRHGVPKQSAAAATAVLSPSTDWNQNVSMAERVGDILFTKGKMPWSASMTNKAAELTAEGKNTEIKKLLPDITGRKLDDLDTPTQQAAWIRLYDEAHNPSTFRAIAPDGGYGPVMLKLDGTPKKLKWQSTENIAKAVEAYQSGGDMTKISPLLGQMHKVRNFYNNLMHPDFPVGATVDTHQVAGSLLSPFGSSDIPTKHAMPGTPLSPEQLAQGGIPAKGSAVSGFKGTYPIFEQATRMAGENVGLPPHMMQSGTWEPARTLFQNKSAQQKAAAANIWTMVDKGLLAPGQARDLIFQGAGGIREPWWTSAGGLLSPANASTYR